MFIEFDQRLTIAECRAAPQHEAFGILKLALILFGMAAICWLAFSSLQIDPYVTAFVTSTLCSIAFLLLLLLMVARRQGEKYATATTFHYRIDETGLFADSDKSRTFVSWDLITTAKELGLVYCLKLPSGGAIVISKRSAGPHCEMLSSFLKDRFPKK
jgi:hypothetical protein